MVYNGVYIFPNVLKYNSLHVKKINVQLGETVADNSQNPNPENQNSTNQKPADSNSGVNPPPKSALDGNPLPGDGEKGKQYTVQDFSNSQNAQAFNLKDSPSTFNIKYGDDQIRFNFSPISLNDRIKIRDVFIEPTEYRSFIEKKVLVKKEQRVILIVGANSCGKVSCGIKLGLEMQEKLNSQLTLCSYALEDRKRLFELVSNTQFPKNSWCLIQDAFKKGIDPAELKFPYLSSLNERLLEKNAFLVLTSNLDDLPKHEVELIFKIQYGDDQTQIDDFLKRVFWSHYRFIFSENLENVFPEEFFKTIEKKVLNHLSSPSDINRFYDSLRNIDITSELRKQIEIRNQRENIKLYIEAIDEGQKQEFIQCVVLDVACKISQKTPASFESPRSWFNGLNENQRLYAMLVWLFDQLDRFTLNELYLESVDHLRIKGISNLANPRELGFEDLIESIQAVEDNGVITFLNPSFQTEIDWQISNRHSMLWLLVDVFEKHIQNYKGPEFWQLRRAYGIAIGRLARNFPQRLTTEINRLVQHGSGGVRVVAAYALAELCNQGEDFFPLIRKLLSNWIETGDPDDLWAASVCARWVYDALFLLKSDSKSNKKGKKIIVEKQSVDLFIEQIWEMLRDIAVKSQNNQLEAIYKGLREVLDEKVYKQLSQNQSLKDLELSEEDFYKVLEKLIYWQKENLKTFITTLSRTADTDPTNVVDHLLSWINDKNADVNTMGLVAAFFLMDEDKLKREAIFTPRQEQSLRLVLPLIQKFPITAEEILTDLYTWFHPGIPAEVIKCYSQQLGQVVLYLNSTGRKVFQAALTKTWFRNVGKEYQEIDGLGFALLKLICFFEGEPILPSVQGWIGFGIDDSTMGRKHQSQLLAEALYARLNARVPTYVFLMGQNKVVGTPERVFHSLPFSHKPRPRLLIPALDAINHEEQTFMKGVVALSFGPITDLDDFETLGVQDSLVVVKPDNIPAFTMPEDKQPYWLRSKGRWTDNISLVGLNGNSEIDWLKFDQDIDRLIATQLIELPPDDTFTLIEKIAEFNFCNSLSAISQLRDWVSKENEYTLKERLKHCTAGQILILSLYRKDPQLVIKELQCWFTDNTTGSPFPIFASAYTHLLLKTALYEKVSLSDNEKTAYDLWIDRYSPLITLLLSLIKQSNDYAHGVTVLSFVHRCILTKKAKITGQSVILKSYTIQYVELVKAFNPADKTNYVKLHEKWLNEQKGQTDEVFLYLDRMILLLNISSGNPLPDLKEGQKYIVILAQLHSVSVTSSSETGDNTEQKLIADLLNGWPKVKPFAQYVPVVFRLGQTTPLSFSFDGNITDFESQTTSCGLPLLSAPIIELFPRDKLAFILMLNEDPVLDLEDWLDNSWNSIVPTIWYSKDSAGQSQSGYLIPVSANKKEPITHCIFDVIDQLSKGTN